MASPKTVGQFYVETTRQSAKSAASSQDAAARYMSELAGVGLNYIAEWSNAQQANLQSAFQLQNAMIQATQTLWDASIKANESIYDEWARAVVESQAAMAKLVAAGVSMLDSAPRRAS